METRKWTKAVSTGPLSGWAGPRVTGAEAAREVASGKVTELTVPRRRRDFLEAHTRAGICWGKTRPCPGARVGGRCLPRRL
jgi:hypothetical protein